MLNAMSARKLPPNASLVRRITNLHCPPILVLNVQQGTPELSTPASKLLIRRVTSLVNQVVPFAVELRQSVLGVQLATNMFSVLRVARFANQEKAEPLTQPLKLQTQLVT